MITSFPAMGKRIPSSFARQTRIETVSAKCKSFKSRMSALLRGKNRRSLSVREQERHAKTGRDMIVGAMALDENPYRDHALSTHGNRLVD